MPHLPIAVSERLGWRTHLPPMQVYRSVARWCAQITAERATIFSDRLTDAAQILRRAYLKVAMNKNRNCRAKVYHNNRVASKADQANAFPNVKREYERYMALAKASPLSGASVETENYHQHAEHYLRMMRGRRFVVACATVKAFAAGWNFKAQYLNRLSRLRS